MVELERLVGSISPACRLAVIPEADHVFNNRLRPLEEVIVNHYQEIVASKIEM